MLMFLSSRILSSAEPAGTMASLGKAVIQEIRHVHSSGRNLVKNHLQIDLTPICSIYGIFTYSDF